MKIRYLLVPCALALGLGLVLALLWLLDGGIALAAVLPAPGEGRGPSSCLLRASSGAITVCLEGGCDYASIQAAVDAADEGDVIKVATGTYTDVNDHGGLAQVVYVSKTVTIRGGYTTAFTDPPDPDANPTTLDAEGRGRVLYITGDISPTIEGLRITGGDSHGVGDGPCGYDGGGACIITAMATINNCQVFDNAGGYSGGGLYLENSAATLSGNTVTSNTVVDVGGGLYLKNSDATLCDNTISANVAWWDGVGSGLYLDESDATLISNTITANVNNGWGGGMSLSYSAATLIGNTVASNTSCYGGGIALSHSAATLSRNTIFANDACVAGGGLSLWRSAAMLSGNTIIANTADDGGGLELGSSDATLTNDIIADNRAAAAGSGLYIEGSSPRLLHTTIARNSGGDGNGVYVTDHSTVALTNTILVSQAVGVAVAAGSTATLEATLWGSGAWANTTDWGGAGTVVTGTVNLWDAPAFVDPGGGDYHISSSSAARNAGIDVGVGQDVDGEVRPMDWDYDIGADEYPGVGLEVAKQPSAFFLNPGQAFTYTIVVTSAGMGDATGVVLTDTMDGWQRPTGAVSSLGSCDIVDAGWGGTVVCSPGTLVTGESVVVTLTARVSTTVALRQAMVNTVVVTANETRNDAQITTYGHDCHARINDDSTEYVTVQAAVDAASPGDVVKVAGICMGAGVRGGVRQQVYVDKRLTIRGGYTTTHWTTPNLETNATTLDAQGRGRVLYIAGDVTPTVEGLRITGGDACRGGGVYVIAATAIVSNNLVFDNTASDGGGLYLDKSAAVLRGNTVTANSAIYGGGLYLRSSAATLGDNTVTANNAEGIYRADGGGLYLDDSDATLSGNTISSNNAAENGGGLCLVDSTATLSGNAITDNTAYDHGGGLALFSSAATLSGNTVADNAAYGYGGGLYLTSSAATLSGNTVTANTAHDDGGGLHLFSSAPTLSRNTIADNTAYDCGGGLYLSSSTATLSGNTVTANTAHDDGGGLYLSSSAATLSANIVTANITRNGGGGLYLSSSDASFSGNTVFSNTARDEGGGLSLSFSDATLSRDTIIGNIANGFDWSRGGGGLYLYRSDVTLANTVIADNRANAPGSGLYISGSSPRLLHTTVARNSGGDGSGFHVTDVWSYYSDVAMTNTILVSQTLGITVTAGNSVTLEATLWGSGPWANDTDWGGAGTVITGTPARNTWGAPDFADGGDYHIGSESAAIDRGVNAGVVEDMDGDKRPVDGDLNGVAVEDLGADEFTPPCIYLPLVLRQ